MPRVIGTAAAIVAALALAGPAAADSLTSHDKAAIELLVLKRERICADCSLTPDFDHARWRFASDFDAKRGLGIAYASVRYKSIDKTRQAQWLLGFDYFSGRWKILAQGQDGSFVCSTAVLLDPNIRIAYQMRMIARVARCE